MALAVEDFRVELAGGVDASAAARQALIERAPGLPELVQSDVLLLVSELVTNAVRHAGVGPDGSVRLECRSVGDRLRFMVSDPGIELLANGGPPRRTGGGTNGDPSRGWGLYFVEQIAERWGVLAASPGTCVWFEVAA